MLLLRNDLNIPPQQRKNMLLSADDDPSVLIGWQVGKHFQAAVYKRRVIMCSFSALHRLKSTRESSPVCISWRGWRRRSCCGVRCSKSTAAATSSARCGCNCSADQTTGRASSSARCDPSACPTCSPTTTSSTAPTTNSNYNNPYCSIIFVPVKCTCVYVCCMYVCKCVCNMFSSTSLWKGSENLTDSQLFCSHSRS